MDKLILRKYIILYLLILIGIFIQFTFLGAVGNIIIKIMIISAISYYLYDSWLREGNKESESSLTEEESESELQADEARVEDKVFEKDEVDIELPKGINKNQFDFLQRQFELFIKIVSPKNAYLCYKTPSNEVFLLKTKLSEGFSEAEDIIPEEVITLIDRKSGLLIENKLDGESSLLPYYNDKDYTAESVLGFKTELGKAGALYWVADDDKTNAFNREDVPYLEALSENTRQFLSAESLAERAAVENDIMSRNFDLTMKLHEAGSIAEKVDEFVTAIVENFEASKLTVYLLKNLNSAADMAVVQKTVGLQDGFEAGYEFPVAEGLNGWVVMKNKVYLIDDIDKGEYFIPRYSRDEKSNFGLRSYLAVPIPFKTQAVGAVTLEHTEANKYNNEDKEKLIAYCSIFAKAIGKDVITESGG